MCNLNIRAFYKSKYAVVCPCGTNIQPKLLKTYLTPIKIYHPYKLFEINLSKYDETVKFIKWNCKRSNTIQFFIFHVRKYDVFRLARFAVHFGKLTIHRLTCQMIID